MTAEKVLIALNGSEFSRRILSPVVRFLSPQEAEIILLYVAPLPAELIVPPSWPPSVDTLILPEYELERATQGAARPTPHRHVLANLEGTLTEGLQVAARLLREAGYSVTTAVRFGNPADEIINFVEDEAVDLVAMATHGRTGLSRILLGSVADQVVRRVSVPVLLVRPFGWPSPTCTPGAVLADRLAEGKPLQVAVATDGVRLAPVVATLAGDLGRALSAEVTLLVVIQDGGGAPLTPTLLKSARNALGEVESRGEMVTLVGFNYEVVLEHLAETPCDLLIITPFEDRSSSHPSAIGLTAERLVHLAPTSVLVVKEESLTLSQILACPTVGDEVVFDVAAQLARVVGAELRVLPVRAMPEDEQAAGGDIPLPGMVEHDAAEAPFLKACAASLAALGFNPETVMMPSSTLPEAIFKAAAEGTSDLIVVGSRAAPEDFLGSLADRVVRCAARSVLIVRATCPSETGALSRGGTTRKMRG